jgi:TRAP-type C4-dicarboxylate transport system permease small subunit
MLRIARLINRVTLAVSLVSYGGVLAIMLLNVGDVFVTKFFTAPITGAYEITEVLLLCTIMASFAYAQSQKAHINMGMVIRRFPRPLGLGIYSVMGLLSAATAGAVGYAAVLQAQSAMSRDAVTSVLQIPLYPFYYVEAAAMFMLTAVLLYDAVLAAMAVRNKEYAEMVISSWA